MLKKKIMSILLSIAMLMSISAVSVLASSTDAIKESITDSTSYDQYPHQFNRLHTNVSNLTAYSSDATLGQDIGSEGNVCAKFTAESATIANESRFDTNKVTYDGSTSSNSSIGPALYPNDIMYWSLDVWGNTAIDDIQFKSKGGTVISPVISKDALKADQWNTLTVIMYPNTTDATYMGSVDLFINGAFVSNTDRSSQLLEKNSNTKMEQLRFTFKFTSTESVLYVDNAKVGLLTSFTRPAVASTGDITVADKVISNYGATTVSALESTLGVDILTAEGVAADDSAKVVSGMKAVASNTITGVGTFTDEYTFGSDGTTGIKTVLADSSSYETYSYGYSKIFYCALQTTRDTAYEAEYACKVNAVETNGRWSVYKTSGEPDTSEHKSVAVANPAEATKPMYWSFDVFGSSVINKIKMQTNSDAMSPEVTYSQLKPNQWNTFTVVYYPNTEDTTKLGYSDFYLNGKFVESLDLSGRSIYNASGTLTNGKEYRVIFYGNNTTDSFRFDNIKLYEMNSFVRPDIKAGVDVVGGKITGYLTSTVGELETATGANIVTASGTDADANATAVEGMKAVVSGEVEGVGTFTTEYELGSPDKVYVSEDFSSSSSYKNSFYDSIGYSAAVEDGTLKLTTGSQDDGSDGTKDIRFALKTDSDTGYVHTNGAGVSSNVVAPLSGDPLVYNIDLKPAAGMQSFRFDTSGQKWSDELPASMFNIGEWNNIKLVFYKTAIQFADGWESDIYVNDKLVSRGYRNSSTNLSLALRLHIITAATGDVYYIDNLEVSSALSFARPEFTSEAYTVTGGSGTSAATINGYKGMTVQQIKDDAVKADNVTVEIYKADGTVADATAVVDNTMYAVATRDEYSCRYNFGVADYSVFDWECTIDGEALTGNTYTPGKLVVKLPVANYIAEEPVTFNVIIAEYADDRFVNAEIVPASVTTVDGYGQAEYTLTAGHTYKILAWESMDTLTPFVKTVKTLTE